MNLLLSTLLTAVFYTTLGLLHRQQLLHNPVIPMKWIHGYIPITQQKIKTYKLMVLVPYILEKISKSICIWSWFRIIWWASQFPGTGFYHSSQISG